MWPASDPHHDEHQRVPTDIDASATQGPDSVVLEGKR